MKFVIASCCKLQSLSPQPVWDEIRAERPDALLLLGDTVYLDRDDHTEAQALAAELAHRYALQKAEPHFAALLADLRLRGKPLLTIYDDHDFLGDERCGADAPDLRDAARQALVDAFDPPRTGAELYSSQVLGPVRVIMLDVRYHRSGVSPAAAIDADAVLGAAQWAWLEAELARRDTPFVMIASSTTFHAWRGLSWEAYPAAFERLRRLLVRRSGASVVAGDIHANGLYDDSGVIEIVSSGVARRSLHFGALQTNYGVLNFDAQGLRISLRSNKPGNRFETAVALADWKLS